MACTKPNYRVDARKPGFLRLPEDFKKRVKNDGVFFGRKDYEYLVDVCKFPRDLIQIIKCGQCIDCRLSKSREWSVRLDMEANYHNYVYFITLTYSDLFVPRGTFHDYNGDIKETTLKRADIQGFNKRLRELMRERYGVIGTSLFYCGEYGDLFDRPHYHEIFFSPIEFPDKEFMFRHECVNHYTSPLLTEAWSDSFEGVVVPKGIIEFSEASPSAYAYVAQYTLKKQTGKIVSDFLERHQAEIDSGEMVIRTPPFVGMSNRPAIGKRYLDDHMHEIYDFDSVIFKKKYDVLLLKPPRYFDQLYDKVAHDHLELIKDKRKKMGILSRDLKSQLVSTDEVNRMRQENNLSMSKEARRKRCL